MHKSKSPKTHSSIYSKSPALNPLSPLAYRPFGSQLQKASVAPKTQTDVENEVFAQQKMEATRLEIQAKYGSITPEGQERLTVLQAKMDGLLNSRLEHARRFGHNIANIPLHRPDTPTPIQAKLTIGEPGDKYEQEADETARQVVQRIHQPQSDKHQRESFSDAVDEELQKKPEGNIHNGEMPRVVDELQMKPMVQRALDGGMAAFDLETSIQQARGSGQRLADSIKSPMEQAFGADFSGVKVHTDTQADQLNQSIQAKAFTTGQDVFFRQGAYEPGTRGGQELLAHELTHVVQQNEGAVQRVSLGAPNEKVRLNFSVAEPVVQRTLENNVDKNTEIKIWDAEHEEVKTVYYQSAKSGQVGYSDQSILKKGKKADIKWVREEYAFSRTLKDKQVEAEIKLLNDINEKVAESGKNIPKAIIDFMMEKVTSYINENMEEEAHDVQLDAARMQSAILDVDALNSMIYPQSDDEEGNPVEEFKSVINDDGDYYITEIITNLQGLSTSEESPSAGSGGKGGGAEEWKTTKTEKNKIELLGRMKESQLKKELEKESSLHHKMSRSRLKTMLTRLSETAKEMTGVREMTEFIAEVRTLTGASDDQKAVENWAANIELGPKVENRKDGDDPKEEFDGNYPSGTGTPRTENLQKVDAWFANADNTKKVVPWEQIAAWLTQTQKEHEQLMKGVNKEASLFSHPNENQWERTDKGYIRDKRTLQ